MRFKTAEQAAQFDNLEHENPMLYGVLLSADALARERFGMSVLITSIHRTSQDPLGLHEHWRAADLRIFHPDRDPDNLERVDPTRQEWESIAATLNNCFNYGMTHDGRPTTVFKIRLASAGHHKDPLMDHVHCQVRRVGRWT